MNPDRFLLRLGQRAARLTGSRSPPVAKAARRARGAAASARHAIATDADLRLVVAAVIEALLIVDALETRLQRRGNRLRARHLAALATNVERKFSDAAIAQALADSGGNLRQAARALGASPSTVSRRKMRAVTARNTTPRICFDDSKRPRLVTKH